MRCRSRLTVPSTSTASPAREGIEGLLDGGGNAEHHVAGRPQGGGPGPGLPAVLGRFGGVGPVPEREVHVGDGGVEERLVEAVTGLGDGVGEELGRRFAFAAPGGEHGGGPGDAQDPDGEGVVAHVPGQGVLRLGPAAEAQQAFGGLGVEVAAEAVVQAGQVPLRDLVERGVDRLLVASVVEEHGAQVDHRERSSLRRRGGDVRVAAQLDSFARGGRSGCGRGRACGVPSPTTAGHRPDRR